MTEVAVGQQQLRQAIQALPMQEGRHHKARGGFVAAIDQQIIRAAGRVRKNRIAAAQRKHGDACVTPMLAPLNQAGDGKQPCSRSRPKPSLWREQPTRDCAKQERVIDDETGYARGLDVEVSS